jgi:hypothetical protein
VKGVGGKASQEGNKSCALVIRFEQDLCDQKLTSLHLSFTVKNKKQNRFYFLLISPTLLALWIKGRSRRY